MPAHAHAHSQTEGPRSLEPVAVLLYDGCRSFESIEAWTVRAIRIVCFVWHCSGTGEEMWRASSVLRTAQIGRHFLRVDVT